MDRPILFLVAALTALTLHVLHCVRIHGWKRARRLLLAVLALAWFQWITTRQIYIVELHLPDILRALVVTVGWMLTALLCMDFARNTSWFFWPSRSSRILFRVPLACLAGATMGHAIEPVAQLAGWWHFAETECSGRIPCFEDKAWAFQAALMLAVGSIAASEVSRRRMSKQILKILMVFLVLGILLTATMILIPPAAPFLILAELLGCVFFPWFQLSEELTALEKASDRGGFDALPLVASSLVLGTLAYYSWKNGRLDFMRYSVGLAVVSLISYVARRAAVRSFFFGSLLFRLRSGQAPKSSSRPSSASTRSPP